MHTPLRRKESSGVYECNFENGDELDGAYELALDIFGEPFENIPIKIAPIITNIIILFCFFTIFISPF